MTQSISINPYTWVNLSSELNLVADTVYDFKISGTLGYIAQLATEPTSTGQATQLTSVSPSIDLKETAGLSIYALGSNANIVSVNESFDGSGGGGGETTPLGAISPTVETDSTSIVASEQTNYTFIGTSGEAVDIDISAIPDNRSLFMFTSVAITLTVNGLQSTNMAANTYVEIIKSATFGNGFNILGG